MEKCFKQWTSYRTVYFPFDNFFFPPCCSTSAMSLLYECINTVIAGKCFWDWWGFVLYGLAVVHFECAYGKCHVFCVVALSLSNKKGYISVFILLHIHAELNFVQTCFVYWHVFLSLPMFAHSAHFYFFWDAQPQRLHSGTLREVFVLCMGESASKRKFQRCYKWRG